MSNEPNELQQAALDYASRGWAIFPCNGKLPATVEGCKNATTDEKLIAETWKSTPYDIGLATGEKSGVVVLDIDADKGGIASLDNLEAEHGPLPMTVTACTGGGGYHYYFRYPATEIRNRTGIRPGIDVRGEGGYVIAPPSSHVSGDSYRWDEASAPDECELAEVPAWLLELMQREPEPSRQNLASLSSSGRSDLHQRAQQYIARATSASEGQRNAAAFSLAGNLAAFVDESGGRLSEAEILSYVGLWNQRNSPPLDEVELQGCVNSALTNGTPRADKPAPQRSDPSRLILPEETVALPPIRIEPIPFAELRKNNPMLSDPVLEGLFRAGETCNLIATSKAGKSWLVYDLALSVATGKQWLETFNTKCGKVLLVDNELQKSVLAYRIPKVAEAKSMFPSDYEGQLDVVSLRSNLCTIEELDIGLAWVPENTYRLMILDAKYRFGNGASENENSAETKFYNKIDQIAGRTGAAIVLVHHASKGNQAEKSVVDTGAGAGAQARATDCHMVLRPHEEPGVVVLDAAVRSFPPITPLALKWDFPLWTPVDADTRKLQGRQTRSEQRQAARDREGIEKIISALADGPATPRQLRESTGISRDRLSRLLDRLYSEEQVDHRDTEVRGNKSHEYYLAT